MNSGNPFILNYDNWTFYICILDPKCGMFKNPSNVRFTINILAYIKQSNLIPLKFAGVPNARQETEIWDKSSQKNTESFLQWDILLQTGDNLGPDFHLHWQQLLYGRSPIVRPLTKHLSFLVSTTIAFQNMIRWDNKIYFMPAYGNIFENFRLITKKYLRGKLRVKCEVL